MIGKTLASCLEARRQRGRGVTQLADCRSVVRLFFADHGLGTASAKLSWDGYSSVGVAVDNRRG
jgi:hypothetical protein